MSLRPLCEDRSDGVWRAWRGQLGLAFVCCVAVRACCCPPSYQVVLLSYTRELGSMSRDVLDLGAVPN